MPISLDELWDFQSPELSEQRFVAALSTLQADTQPQDVLILHTQIARTYSMRGDYVRAQEILRQHHPAIKQAGGEAAIRHQLEWGRTFASGRHAADAITAEAKATARGAYEQALALAKTESLDGLAIDAIHMLAFVDSTPKDQLYWAEEALTLVAASNQPEAKRWQASLLNNKGYALHQLGQLEDALVVFKEALLVRKTNGDAWTTHIAQWMVAWTLRGLGQLDEALAIQLRLEQERAAVGEPDGSVYEELAALYEAKGDAKRAAEYVALEAALKAN